MTYKPIIKGWFYKLESKEGGVSILLGCLLIYHMVA